MELEVNSAEPVHAVVENVETVEVISGGGDGVMEGQTPGASELMEQHMLVTHPQELMAATSEVSARCVHEM